MNKEIDQAFVSNNVKLMVTKTFSLAFNNLEIEAVSSKYVLLVNGKNDITSSILVQYNMETTSKESFIVVSK